MNIGKRKFQVYGMPMYNPRIGRLISADPLATNFTDSSAYQFASNSPITDINLNGLEFYYAADENFMSKIRTSQQVDTA